MSSMRSASSRTRTSSPAKLGVRMLHVVEQSAGAGDDEIDAAAQCPLLGRRRHATVDRGRAQLRVTSEGVEVLDDLSRQFAGRREHQSPSPARRAGEEAVHDRQQEGRGLAAAGHGAGEQIPARQAVGNAVALNRGRCGEAHVGDAAL